MKRISGEAIALTLALMSLVICSCCIVAGAFLDAKGENAVEALGTLWGIIGFWSFVFFAMSRVS